VVAGSALGNSVAAALVPGHGRPPLYIVTRASGSAKAESSCSRGPRLRRPDWQIGRRLFDIIDPESTRIVRLLPEVTDSYRFVAQQKTGICREGRRPRAANPLVVGSSCPPDARGDFSRSPAQAGSRTAARQVDSADAEWVNWSES
jgi:hypothetical protein